MHCEWKLELMSDKKSLKGGNQERKIKQEQTTMVGWCMVFNATFNNISAISWQSVLLVEETGENQQPVVSHRQTWVGFELTTLMVIGTDCMGSCKSNYNAITTTAAPNNTMTKRKMTNNDILNTTQKTIDWVTWTLLTTVNTGAPEG